MHLDTLCFNPGLAKQALLDMTKDPRMACVYDSNQSAQK